LAVEQSSAPGQITSFERELVLAQGGNALARTRAILVAMALTSLLLPGDQGWCGPIFNRVMKSGTVRLGLPYNRVPQGFLKPNGEWVGFEVDLGTEMAKHMNLKLEAVKVNDKTWPTMLAEGRIDAALCRIRHTRSLEGEYDFSIAYFFDSVCALIPKGGFKSTSDFKGHKIAAVQGSSAEKTAMRLLRESGDESAEKNVVSYPDRASCFMALGREKVSAWVDSGVVLLEYASRSPGRFELMPVSHATEEIAVALPQDDSAWRDLINFTIQDMAADGSLKKVYDQWFGPDTPYPFPNRRSIGIWSE
jgi:polar amino acid transport system substrate-binding protein